MSLQQVGKRASAECLVRNKHVGLGASAAEGMRC